MGLCGSIPEEVEVEDTVESCDLKEVGKMARPRLILAKCTEDDVTDRYTIPLKTISTGNVRGVGHFTHFITYSNSLKRQYSNTDDGRYRRREGA